MNSLSFERAYPWCSAVMAAVLFWWFIPLETSEKIVQKLPGSIIEVSAIAFGFVMTVTSILISIEGKHPIKTLREIGVYRELLGYLKIAMYSWILVCASTVILSISDVISSVQLSLSIWVALLTLALLSTYRVAGVMFELLSLPDKQQTTDVPPQKRAVG
jgi:hypothetical protein